MKVYIRKILIVLMLTVLTIAMTSCGDDDKADPTVGYQGNPCNSLTSGFSGFKGPFPMPSDYPDQGSFLQNNPNAVFRYNGSCYPGNDVYNMYQQYGMPWYMYDQSPFSQFEMYYPGYESSGNYNYNSTVNMSGSWVNSGDFFNGLFTPRTYPGQWGFNVYYQGKK
ncbi:MAG: hypothetical protein HY390_08015 [Deltaproteobacteria bacterium]|nr:hypothetical protein [Deltaproteobacteria bacterium]